MINRYILFLTDAVFSVIEFLLSLRIVLKLLGAHPAPFVSWVFETTRPLLSPFEGMFPSSTLAGGFTLEASALFALLIYGFLGFLIQSIVLHLIPHYRVEEDEEETVVEERPVKTTRRIRR